MTRLTNRLACAAALAGLAGIAHPGRAQGVDSSGVVVGYVIDQLGQPITGVELLVVDAKPALTTRTGPGGAYRLEGISPGPHLFRVRRLGYIAFSATVVVKARDTEEENFVLARLPQTLDPVVVQAENGEMRGAIREFYERRKHRVGTFIDRSEIARRNPSRTSDLARTMAGFRVQPNRSMIGGYQVVSARGPTSFASPVCHVQLFVNGAPYTSVNGLDDFHPQDIEAIEAYRGGAELPAQFNTGSAGCGAIVIWLRR